MEQQPSHRNHAAEDQESRLQARDDWFARVLGESWRSDGDGIYRYVPEIASSRASTDGGSPPGAAGEADDALNRDPDRGRSDVEAHGTRPRRSLLHRWHRER